VSAEVARPVAVTQDNHLPCAGQAIVFLIEDASQSGANSQHLKIVSGYEFAAGAFRLSLPRNAQRDREARQQSREDVVVVSHFFVQRIRQRSSAAPIAPPASLI